LLDANGAPHFIAKGRSTPAVAADANWDDRFGEAGVQNGFEGASVNAVAVSGSNVLVGGFFPFAGGAPRSYIERWDGKAWNDLSGCVTGVPTDEGSIVVNALALSGTTSYVGGIFTSAVNSTSPDRIRTRASTLR
jgi:hypothetical protein